MDIKEYEEFCKNSKYGNFMQSADWAKVKKGWICLLYTSDAADEL